MTTLSTHVLDTMHGRAAAQVALVLMRGEEVLFEGDTDADGRCPALRDLTLAAGAYRLRFAIADYFAREGAALADPPFLDQVVVEFGIAAEGHCHVPLLVSPFAYSTYRGS